MPWTGSTSPTRRRPWSCCARRRCADRGAATDQGNTPMAATFARAGYPVEWERIDLV
ncbi:hypothetical protein [Micromonospora sp. MA102]|uniref:hypothetical protein n=1 Tax=Micromonospora sp. MA102 TaxID=2952755 RepID=UPI0021C9560B|nr:hypothetical protein [Micromonospora sp. MA102]